MPRTFTATQVFDGTRLHNDMAVVIEGGRIVDLIPAHLAGANAERLDGLIAPGFVDLQVNGGGGHQIGGQTTVDQLAQVCDVHLRMGTTQLLPTLITDTPEVTARVIDAGIAAARAGVPGFAGLHLEGPHLDPRRKGAHDAALIRPMTADDLSMLERAAAELPALMVTLAPEAVRPDQIERLARAGVVVSLGHSDCSLDQARRAIAAGARCATHLFNAMSPLGSREPGLVGAVLLEGLPAGLIADGIHVHPETLRLAQRLNPEGLFAVSDCMAFAGTDLQEMHLGGRLIRRRAGRLELTDGTLAGADLTLPRALEVLIGRMGLPPETALSMVTRRPARLIGAQAGEIRPGARADLVLLRPDWTVAQVWGAGIALL
jgi:N-acetylglucosamine-6-phosphate deacetylase